MASTIRDITKMTGLSLATVSKYLNGGNVLPGNREKIEDAIEKLHYEVNEVARGLATNRTRTVGILTHRLDNMFSGTIITEMEDILRKSEYGTIVCGCGGDEKLEEEALRFLMGKRVDGILAIPSSSDSSFLKPALDRDIPVVLIDRAFCDRDLDCVLVDNEKASCEAVSRLIAYGHRRIGIISGKETTYTARERLKGYYRAHREAELPILPGYVEQGPMMETEYGYQAMKRMLSLEQPPTAVFLTNYEITLGGIIALNEKGVRFPDDISIIGFDNMMISRVVKPKLWMVSQPMKEIARQAAGLMLKRLSGEQEEHKAHIVLETEMFEGESVRVLNG
ncbi:MAG: LacI family DNA-binding transcriptional regulator [Candidatus Choladocola sp.]|nr:LacI family DNA-binding transcriptional regulator [Candidatus Choladocola sp.]